jgi:hypothetical protein
MKTQEQVEELDRIRKKKKLMDTAILNGCGVVQKLIR